LSVGRKLKREKEKDRQTWLHDERSKRERGRVNPGLARGRGKEEKKKIKKKRGEKKTIGKSFRPLR